MISFRDPGPGFIAFQVFISEKHSPAIKCIFSYIGDGDTELPTLADLEGPGLGAMFPPFVFVIHSTAIAFYVAVPNCQCFA